MLKNKQNKQNKIEYCSDTMIDTKYLFILILLFFIQPNFSALDETSMNFEFDNGISLGISKDILQMQMNYAILVLVIVLFYLKTQG